MDAGGRSGLTRDVRHGRSDESGEQDSPPPDITQSHLSSLYGRDSYMPSKLSERSYMADEGASSSRSMSNWPYINREMWARPRTQPYLGSTSMSNGASASGVHVSEANLNMHDLSPLSASQGGESASGMQMLNRNVMDDAPEMRLAELYSTWKSAAENPRQLPTSSSSAERAVLGDCLENVKERISLDSLPMLVQHEIRLEDGSIRTYFSLPRESTSDVLRHQADNGRFTSPHDYLSHQNEEKRSSLATTNLQEQCREDESQARWRDHSEGREDYLGDFHTFEPDSRKWGSVLSENDLHDRRRTGLQREEHTQLERRLQRELDSLASAIEDANWACGERSGCSISSHACAREGSRFHDPHDHLSRDHNYGNMMADNKSILQLDNMREHGRLEELSEHVYKAFVHYAKVLNENPEERTKLEKQGKGGTLLCLTCKRFSKPYSDTHSLVMHTFMSRKRGLRAEHLGLRKAICTVMGWSPTLEPGIGKRYQHITSEEAKVNKEDLILWPPALIIHNALVREGSVSQARVAVEDLFKDAGLSYSGIEVVVGNVGSLLVEYNVPSSCLLEAERLHQHLASKGRGRDGWLQVSIGGHKESMPKGRHSIMEKEVLYGYLACAHDLDLVDRDFRRRCLVLSRKVAVNPFA